MKTSSGLEDYISKHIEPEPPELYEIDRQTNLKLLNGRMCSGHIQGRILKMLAAMIKPKRVLELGTFSGYSALCLAEGIDGNATLDTIEVDDELEDFILNSFKSSIHGNKIRLHIGDALEVMKQWGDEEFDLIFIDADKRKYVEYLNRAITLTKPGGFILADNTLWDGHVVEDTPHSSQTLGIMDFNDLAASDKRVETVILPLRDGLTIMRKVSS